MILMNRKRQMSIMKSQQLTVDRLLSKIRLLLPVILIISLFSSCGVYTFRDVSVDYSKIKTVKVGFIDNKARYINPQLSPRLTDNIKQKISNFTKLTLVTTDDANLSLQQAESRLGSDIIDQLTDQIFNHIFSNW